MLELLSKFSKQQFTIHKLIGESEAILNLSSNKTLFNELYELNLTFDTFSGRHHTIKFSKPLI